MLSFVREHFPRDETMWQGLTLVPVPAQLELTMPPSAQLKPTLSPAQPNFTHGCGSKVLKLSSNVSDVFPKVLKLSSEVSECKPLACGTASPRQGLTLVHISAQVKLSFVPTITQRKPMDVS